MNPAVQRTRSSLIIVLTGGTLGWLFFVAGTYFDMLLVDGYTTDELWGDDPVSLVYPSKYLILAAIASLAFAALVAKRRILGDAADTEPGASHGFRTSVLTFANVAMIVALALSAFAGVGVFMSGFFDGSPDVQPLVRVLDVYLPIILYTALLVTVILAGFVFLRHPETVHVAPAQSPVTTPTPIAPAETRALAFAYAVPIIAAAIALILGLIVYDITKTALEVWIWVFIVAIVATGIIVGTRLARTATDRAATSPGDTHHSGVTVGAVNLNLVLSVVFAVAVTIMALGYGASATSQLQSNTYASISVHDTDMIEVDVEGLPIDRLSVQADGSDLERSSTITVTLTPGDEVLLEETVDRSGYVYVETTIGDLDAGDYTLTFDYTNGQGVAESVSLDFAVADEGATTFADGPQNWSDDESSKLLPATFGWVMSDLFPAFILWVLSMLVIYLTLTVRNRHYPLSM